MLKFETEDNKIWAVPDGLVAASTFLQELAAAPSETPPKLDEKMDVCIALMKSFLQEDIWPAPGPLDRLAAALRLADKLQIPAPGCLLRFNVLIAVEAVRTSGVANPYDFMLVMDLTKELERHHPEYVRRETNHEMFQGMYNLFLYSDTDPEDVVRKIIGEDYDKVVEMADGLRRRHA